MKKKITAIILAVVMLLSTVGTFASAAATIELTDTRYTKEISKLNKMEWLAILVDILALKIEISV